MIGIINYGLGNVGSIASMLRRIGLLCVATCDEATLERCDRLILPGVGAFDSGVRQLEQNALVDLLNGLVLQRRLPTLGICLGMQLMMDRSEEGNLKGLGWIPGEAMRFPPDPHGILKVPNMGWREIEVQSPTPLFATPMQERRFYFVHSYHVRCEAPCHVIATSRHGLEFAAAINKGNIYGVQFHPEKSHRFGMQLLRDFAAIR